MEIYLLRHGIAVDRTVGLKDGDRALTPKGRRKIERIVATLENLGVAFDAIISSPLLRARQTAEVVVQKMKCKQPTRLSKHLLPGTRPAEMVKELKKMFGVQQSILLVGHEPDMSRLASVLLSGGTTLSLELKKGGVCKILVHSFEPGTDATLLWLAPPKLFGAD